MFDRFPSRMPSTKLPIGPVSSPLEKEADRVADHVLRQPDRPRAGHSTAQGGSAPQSLTPLNSSGRPLDTSVRSYFEPRFGFDFSKVRVHADEEAAGSAHAIGAAAYTAGSSIAFGNGTYQPHSGEGRRLIAHELTHVVQQGGAAPLPGAAPVRTSRAEPMIQRDLPKTPPGPLLPLADPAHSATRQDVIEALTPFLYKVQEAQGGQTLHVDEAVKLAVLKIFAGDAMRSASAEQFLQGVTPASPPEFAAAVAKLLPAVIPRVRIAHLGTQKPTFSEDTSPKSLGDAIGHVLLDPTLKPLVKAASQTSTFSFLKDKQKDINEGARSGIADALAAVSDLPMKNAPWSDQTKNAIHSTWEGIEKYEGKPMNRQDPGAGSPYAQPRLGDVTFPQAQGTTIIKSPTIKWDVPTKDPAKPDLPKPPTASESAAVNAIIQGLDPQVFVPAAMKGQADAGIDAKDFATSIADQLADANTKNRYTVEVTLPINYRIQPDLQEIFNAMEALVKRLAAAIPGGVPNVGQVVLTPARADKDPTLPPRRIVHLKGN
jgi:hypothetical protein